MIEHEQTRRTPDGDSPAERRGLRADGPLLTRRQREIAHLIARGHTNAEIGAELHLDRTAVGEAVERLRDRLGLDTRLQIAAWAIEHAPDRDGGD